jgi:IclR family transcriptional regulator, pca regulon regulatory protein
MNVMDARSSRSLRMIHEATLSRADFIEGAARSLSVLESFDVQRQRLNATQTAERTGLTRAAARRHLLTLAHLGYLESDGQFYWLAPRVLRLAGSYLSSARLPRVVRPSLRRLAESMRGNFCVAVLDDQESVIVATSGERTGGEDSAPYGAHLGSRLPAFCTSTGRVLLAALSKKELDAWLKRCAPARRTSKTLTSRRALKQVIATASQAHFSYASEEHELGVHAIAVPLFDATGRCVAALNMVDHLTSTPKTLLCNAGLARLQREANELRAWL